MVDSLYIEASYARPGDKVVWKTIRSDLDTGAAFQSGTLRNLRLRQDSEGRLKVWGSLPKYLKGSNVDTFTRSEITEAVEKLAFEAGIDPDFTRVYGLDLAATMPLCREVFEYFSILGERSRFIRKTYGRTGVAYESKIRTLTFYDKGEEAGIDGNLLRFEVKLKKKLKQQLGRQVVLSDLCTNASFEQLVHRWEKEYRTVQKIKSQPMITEPKDTKDFRSQIERIGASAAGGQETLLAQIDCWNPPADTKKYWRQLVRGSCTGGNSEEDTAMIEELDYAVEAAIEEALVS